MRRDNELNSREQFHKSRQDLILKVGMKMCIDFVDNYNSANLR